MPKKVGVVSLGCAKNLVDTEVMLGLLQQAGYGITNDETEADALIVNTCGFIDAAKEESIQSILKLSQNKQQGNCRALLVTGCLAQRYPKELLAEMPEIDGVIGTGDVGDVVNIMDRLLSGERVSQVSAPNFLYSELMPRVLSTPAYTAYVKIAEGCNNRCSYCAIPDIRGPFRSRAMESVAAEVKQLVQQGIKEIILIAQDTTRYGLDLYHDYKLAELLDELVKIPGLVWIRLLYCYPTHFTDQLISVIAGTDQICRYVDLPLQHASNKILKQMGRRGSKEEIIQLITKLRKAIPNLILRTSFIVGFPGETEADFAELLKFMAEVQFDRVGVFTYSQEEGTPAANMPGQIAEEIKQERYHRAMSLQKEISLKRNQERIGQVLDVLVEGQTNGKKGLWYGRSQGDAPSIDGKVYFQSTGDLPVGKIIKVRITKGFEYDLMGELSP